jgi:hypothetical protein
MCIGGSVLSLASFAIVKALGYSNLAQQPLELSAAFVTVCLALAMAAYMAVRGYGRRRNVVMTGSTVGVGIVVIALLWSGAISASGPQTWQSLFGLICPRPAWSWSWRRCSASTSTAAEHAITALRLDQRRHLRLAQPDSRPAPGYLDRRSILATGRRVQDRRSRSHATPAGRPRRGGREWDNKSPRKTASRSTPVAYR